jgi:hypothetical protein
LHCQYCGRGFTLPNRILTNSTQNRTKQDKTGQNRTKKVLPG